MNLWDSVHRGLEKASQEAGRIARGQRLRSSIDKLSRQLETQKSVVLNTTMDLFVAGKMTQNELTPLCQELINLHQQLTQAQAELKQLQSQGPLPAQSTLADPQAAYPPQTPNNPYTAPTELYAAAPTQSPYIDGPDMPPPPPPTISASSTPVTENAMPLPPPPPGVEPFTISSLETHLVGTPPLDHKLLCNTCGAEALSTQTYCQQCGAPLFAGEEAHLPTVRGGQLLSSYPIATGQETVRPDETTSAEDDEVALHQPLSSSTNQPGEEDGGN